jgi:hypothetical protein
VTVCSPMAVDLPVRSVVGAEFLTLSPDRRLLANIQIFPYQEANRAPHLTWTALLSGLSTKLLSPFGEELDRRRIPEEKIAKDDTILVVRHPGPKSDDFYTSISKNSKIVGVSRYRELGLGSDGRLRRAYEQA